MNKNLMIAGFVISITAFGFTLYDGVDIEDSYQTSLLTPKTPIKPISKETKISYTKNTPLHKTSSSVPMQKKQVAVTPKPKTYEYTVHDSKHNYDITLVDTSKKYLPSEMPKSSYYVSINGKVDNASNYSMHIPSHFIANADNVKIKIRNRKTNQIRTASASFLYNVEKAPNERSNERTVVNLDSDDPANYQTSEVARILPPL